MMHNNSVEYPKRDNMYGTRSETMKNHPLKDGEGGIARRSAVNEQLSVSNTTQSFHGDTQKKDEIVRPPLWAVLNAPMCFYMALVHVMGLLGFWSVFHSSSWMQVTGIQAPTSFTIWFGFLLYPIGGFGITVGAHRLWSHRSYQANFGFRLVFMILNSIANQGSIFHWVRDHRVHHLYSDTEHDPHNSSMGFFFCHMGWLLVQKNKHVIEAGKAIDLKDLNADPLVMFQKKLNPFWNLSWCFVLPSVVSYCMGDSWFNGLLIPGAARYLVTLHCTWLVNSFVHTVGESKPYNPAHATTESAIVAILALGEGWHNWHHAYGWDYAAAECDWWRQYNPSKMIIDFAALFGWTWGRKRATHHWQNRRRRWVERFGRDPVEGLRGLPPFQHRNVDYDMFQQSPRNLTDKAKSQFDFAMEETSPVTSPQGRAKCTRSRHPLQL